MAKNLHDCLRQGVKEGLISEDDANRAMTIYRSATSRGASDGEAKTEVANQLAADRAHMERVAYRNAAAIHNAQRDAEAYRDEKGKPDVVRGLRYLFDRQGFEGMYPGLPQDGVAGLSVEEIRTGLTRQFLQMIEEASHAFRKGLITGDKKRTSKLVGSKTTQALLEDMVRVLHGEEARDPKAAHLADIVRPALDLSRELFNQEGGKIGKLKNYGVPHWHDSEKIANAFKSDTPRKAWVDFILPLVDKATKDPLTGRVFGKDELREILDGIWEKIVTNGFVEDGKLVEAAGRTGKGALWSRHADHRFLHFNDADAWLKYNREFGRPDVWGGIVNHLEVMAKDIAVMRRFGASPHQVIEHQFKWVEGKSRSVKSTEAIIREEKAERETQTARLRELQKQMLQPNPEWEKLTDRHAVILDELSALRHSKVGMASIVVGAWNKDPGPAVKQLRDRMNALQMELADITVKLLDMKDKGSEHIIDAVITQQYTDLLDVMSLTAKREPVAFADKAFPVDYANKQIAIMRSLWNSMSGMASFPESIEFANWAATGRNWLYATALPISWVSSLGDPTFYALVRGKVGAAASKANVVSVFKDVIQMWAGPNTTQREAARAWIILDKSVRTVAQAAKSSSVSAKARAASEFTADRVLNLSLMAPYTNAAKAAGEAWMMGHVADHVGLSWDKLDTEFRDTLKRGGFDASGWDAIRSVRLYEPQDGVPFLRPNEIYEVNPGLAHRYIAMIWRENRKATNEPTQATRARVLGDTRPGSLAGEAMRTVFLPLKSFSLQVMVNQWGQVAAMNRAGDYRGGAAYVAAMLAQGMLLGAVVIALKDIAAGRDPRKWFDEETYLDGNFWAAALLQSGGLGIYGDFLFSDINRTGGSLSQTIAGPITERVDALIKLTAGNAIQAARGKDTHFGRELVRVLRQNVPTVLWNKLLMERMVWDRVQYMVDPEAPQAWQREKTRSKNERGQDYWFGPGDFTAHRAPDLSRLLATRK